MKYYLIFATLIISNSSFAQKNHEDVIDSLIIKSLNLRFDLLLSSGIKYIEPNKYAVKVKDKINYPYKLLVGNTLFYKAYTQKSNSLELIRIVPQFISKDTIDINFSQVFLKVQKGLYLKPKLHFKKAELFLSCGGTNGYQPDFRYVYNSNNQSWKNISEKYVIKK